MPKIDAQQVRKLREASGAGIMDCKNALEEAEGSIEDALQELRKRGISDAEEFSDREAEEGRISFLDLSSDHISSVVMAEVNCETDFTAKNDEFIEFSDNVVENVVDTQKDFSEDFDDFNDLFEEEVAEITSKVGEKVVVRRVRFSSSKTSVVGTYIHPGNQIVSCVFLKRDDDLSLKDWDHKDREVLEDLASEVAMHVAALDPPYLDESDIPEKVLETRKGLYRDQAKKAGQPDHVLDQIVEGTLNKWKKESSLLGQNFVREPEFSVKEFVQKETDLDVEVDFFVRLEVGELEG